MNLAINLITTTKQCGSKTYCENFFKYLLKSKHLKNFNKIYVFLGETYLDEINNKNFIQENIKIIKVKKIFQEGILKFFFEQFVLPFLIIFKKIDKIFCPLNYFPLILKIFKIEITLGVHSNLPWVFYDMMPGNIIKKFFIKKLMFLSIYFSNKVIMCSLSSKKQIIKILNLNKKKFYFCYLGVNHLKAKKFIRKSKYILTVSSICKYHPILHLLRSYNEILKKRKSFPKLLIVTQILDENYYSEIRKYISQNLILKKNIKFFFNINKKSLLRLYSKSFMSINLSLIESFGLNSLESMNANCPVLLSNLDTFKEINHSAAIYFNGLSILDTKNKIEKVFDSKKLQNKMIRKGRKNVNLYTWKKTVKKTIDIINI